MLCYRTILTPDIFLLVVSYLSQTNVAPSLHIIQPLAPADSALSMKSSSKYYTHRHHVRLARLVTHMDMTITSS